MFLVLCSSSSEGIIALPSPSSFFFGFFQTAATQTAAAQTAAAVVECYVTKGMSKSLPLAFILHWTIDVCLSLSFPHPSFEYLLKSLDRDLLTTDR